VQEENMCAKLNLASNGRSEGEEGYTDGPVEDELLSRLRAGETPERIIAGDDRFPVLYHLSEERHNLLGWFPFEKDAALLEIGAGPGALTGLFAARVKRVVAVELSRRRAEINLARNGRFDNLEIVVGDFCGIEWEERFDYVTLVGVLEYAGRFGAGGADPYTGFLRRVRERLLPGGRLVLAIENRFGLKYWAGANEDHLGVPFAGLEGYKDDAGVRTFSRAELQSLLTGAGFDEARFYLTLPDYKFPSEIIAEDAADLHALARAVPYGMGEYAHRLFDEGRVQQDLARQGLLPGYANGFLVVASGGDG
jgi:SAM-dependent methyltransferase